MSSITDTARILAAIVGGFAFRSRRSRGTSSPSVAGARAPPREDAAEVDAERLRSFWMRYAVVALAVLGPMFASSRFGVLGAAWRHGLWFWPETPADLSAVGNGPGRDFKDAEQLLKACRATPRLVDVHHPPAEAGKPAGNAVLAWGQQADRWSRSTTRSPDGTKDRAKGIDELNADRDKVPWLPIDQGRRGLDL